jgi:hypothetical protein
MSGSKVGMAVGAAVALCGAVVTLVALPSQVASRPKDPDVVVQSDLDPSHSSIEQSNPDEAARQS